MKQVYNYWMPDTDIHFERLITKRIKKGGPPEYQDDVRTEAYKYVTDFDVGGSVLELASKTAEGICGHVIDGDEEDIGADFFGVSEWKKQERQDEEMFHGWGRILLFKF